MIFETQGRGQYPLKWLPQGKRTLESFGGWADADYQSGQTGLSKAAGGGSLFQRCKHTLRAVTLRAEPSALSEPRPSSTADRRRNRTRIEASVATIRYFEIAE